MAVGIALVISVVLHLLGLACLCAWSSHFPGPALGIGILVEPPGWQYTLPRDLDLGRRGGDTCVLESMWG